jgi:hypothetical protein
MDRTKEESQEGDAMYRAASPQLSMFAIVGIILAGALFLGATTDTREEVGRFQLVSAHQTTTFLIDTSTGRTWRYSHRTDAQSSASGSPCEGLKDCFMEVDRLSVTREGWVSEIKTAKTSSVAP